MTKALLSFLLLSVIARAEFSDDAAVEYDLLITDGLVFDGGTGAPDRGNIGIVGNRIVTTDAAANARAKVIIDARGKLVFPGFIDPHTHTLSDLKNENSRGNLAYLMQGVTTVFIGNDGAGVPEREKNLRFLAENGMGTNVGFFAGHGSIRSQVMGFADRPANEAELEAMSQLLAREMQAGALGLSTGLFYAPGSFAGTDEIIALARVAAGFGGIYDTHMRDEGGGRIGLLGSLDEVFAIARDANISVHIAHLKALGPNVRGQAGIVVAKIAAARASGLEVTADQYPWTASGTRLSNALLLRWVMADSQERTRERLQDATLLERIREEMQTSLTRRGGPNSFLITGRDSVYRGKTLAEAAREAEKDPVETAIDIILDGDPSVASFVMVPSDIETIAVQPWVMTASDGSSGHPRKYATYPMIYTEWVQDRGILSAQQFVHRSSGFVAETFGLCDRGMIADGRIADIVVIDPDTYRAMADYAHPEQLSTGVVTAIVNGVPVISDGRPTGGLPGQVLRKDRLPCSATTSGG